jgi:hypothetical protein
MATIQTFTAGATVALLNTGASNFVFYGTFKTIQLHGSNTTWLPHKISNLTSEDL